MVRRRTLLIVGLISVSLIALELAWTRLFSAEFFYAFAFLVLSLAILGLGLGALALRLAPVLGGEPLEGLHLSLAGLMAVAGPVLVFRLGLDFSVLFASPAMVGRLVAAVILLGAPGFFAGIALASIFRRHHEEMHRLYMADMVGAGVAVAAVIWSMNRLGTPAAAALCALPVLTASFLALRGWRRSVPAVLAAGALALIPGAPDRLEAERAERAPVIYKHWDAMAKIKLYGVGGTYRGINIDNVANSPVLRFDGDFDSPEIREAQWGIDVSWLIDRFDGCTFLSLGAGGGSDVLQALAEGAAEVHAVEVNPHINRMMTVGDPVGYIAGAGVRESAPGPETEGSAAAGEAEGGASAREADPAPPPPVLWDASGKLLTLVDFSGRIYHDPRVRVVSEDARTYVRRHRDRFDLIYSLSSNTWAALGSGSFALAESYIFTKEAFRDYWLALTEDGFLSMEHQVYMPRIVSAVMEALSDLGVEDPASHLAVYDLPKMRRKLLLLSKRPLTDEIRRNAYGELTEEKFDDIHLLHPPPEGLEDNLIHRIITEGWEAVAAEAPVDISPSTDDRPFVAQMGLWRNFDREKLDGLRQWADFQGFPLSKLIMAVILGVVVLLILPLNLLPFVTQKDQLRAAPWLYFFLIGVAFMAVEVVLIQKYALFIGASVYSVATVLLTLLIASGLGSFFSRKVGDGAAFAAIAAWIVLDILILGRVTGALVDLSILSRAMVSALLVAPLGFFMGMPFPKGAERVGGLVDWGFAVNGAASVLGGTLAVVAAFTWGFTAALLAAAALYLAAWGLRALRPAW